MFDSLAEKLQVTLTDVRNRGTLTEQDIDSAMREIRLALLEADVNFKVAREFAARVKERSLGAEVVGGLNPGQQVVKIVDEELTALMGGEAAHLSFAHAVVLPEPCRPAMRITVGGRGENVIPADAPPMRAASSSWTIFKTCWPGFS